MQVVPGRRLLTLTLAGIICVLPAFGCGTATYEQFCWSLHPSLPIKAYTKGNLGVVQPTYARSYLVIAYRYFSGKNLSAGEADQANEMIEDRLARNDTSCDEVDTSPWLNVRNSVAGVPASPAIETTVAQSADVSTDICNIQANAFVTAGRTLQERIAKFGATNPCIKDWIAAQDMVFDNDGLDNKPSIPAPLLSGDKLLQQDRIYQMAAANFYAMRYDEAQKLFASIAADKDSPWSHISGYLAIRSLIRKGTTSATEEFNEPLLTQARKQLDVLLANPSMADLHADLLDLADFVVDKLVPSDKSIARQREHELATAMMKKISKRGLAEYTNVFDKLVDWDSDAGAPDKQPPLLTNVDEITEWINTFQSPKSMSKAHALARWKSTKTLPWLIAALAVSDAQDKDAQALMAEAAKVKSESPAFLTVSYEVAKLLMRQKQYDNARAHVDQALAQHNLDLSSRNVLLALKLQLDRSLPEFIRDSNSKEVGTWSGGGNPELPDTDEDTPKKHDAEVLPLARLMYDDGMPLSTLKTAAESNLYSLTNRTMLAHRAWVRAVLLNNEAIAQTLAADLKKWDKQNAVYFSKYLQAPTDPERKFAAVFEILHDSDSSPSLVNGAYGNGWWWGQGQIGIVQSPYYEGSDSSMTIDYDRVLLNPVFVSAADRATAKSEYTRLKSIAAAPAYLTAIVVDWAKSHPTDARVPEALHLAVRCTRYGERDKESGRLSKEAFEILHHRYARNAWTTDTPYYY